MSAKVKPEDLTYFDAWGDTHSPSPADKISQRFGVFAVIIANDHILLTWPSHREDCVPELPGGGIDDGENKKQALIREVFEETAITIPELKPDAEFDQQIGFYSDKNGAFWDYEQSYWLLKDEALAGLYSDEETKPIDALKAKWVPLSQLRDMKLHAAHMIALAKFDLI